MTAIVASHREVKAFDCTNGSAIIECTNAAALNFDLATPFSLAFWIMCTNAFQNGAMLGKMAMNVGFDRGYAVHGSSGRPGFFISPQYTGFNSDWLFIETATVIANSTERHIAVTYDGTAVANAHASMKLYVDGVLQTVSTFGGPIIGSTFANTQQFMIGGRRNSGGAIDSYKFGARYHDVVAYDDVISAGAIAALASKQRPKPPVTNLVAWWPGIGSVLPTIDDVVGNADGTATAQVQAVTL